MMRPIKAKPIRRARIVVGLGVWRIPETGPITPRLQPGNERTRAIGFRANIISEDNDDE